MTCPVCNKPCDSTTVNATIGGHKYHEDCLLCQDCDTHILGTQFKKAPKKLPGKTGFICEDCYEEKYAPQCAYCKMGIVSGEVVNVGNEQMHKECFDLKQAGKPPPKRKPKVSALVSASQRPEDSGDGVRCDDHGTLAVKRQGDACCDPCVDNCCKKCHWWLIACILNAMACPVIMMVYACKIYFIPCLVAVCQRSCVLCMKAVCCCKCIWQYTDGQFPPNKASLGECKGLTRKGITSGTPPEVGCCTYGEAKYLEKDGKIQWIRGSSIIKETKNLFSGGVTPDDVAQGQLGNCWLLAAAATLADHDGIIESCFVSRWFNPAGKYTMKLFNGKKTEHVTVDDFIPCRAGDGRPLFAFPVGQELWVLLLEKAFAKFMGSYHALEGGLPVFAMHIITGCPCLHWQKMGNGWMAMEVQMEYKDKFPSGKLNPTNTKKDHDELFKLCVEWCKTSCPIGAGSSGKDTTLETGRAGVGIVPGHAYGLMDCREVAGLRLVRLRNPWGTFEWTGNFSHPTNQQGKASWDKNPKALAEVKRFWGDRCFAKGVAWMEWKDFEAHFDVIDVCLRQISIDDITLDMMEDRGACGICCGCLTGCASYWCFCQGCCLLYFNRLCKKDTRQTAGTSGAGAYSSNIDGTVGLVTMGDVSADDEKNRV